MKLPTKGELTADAVIAWCRRNGFTAPAREHRFMDGRKFRFDLAWVDEKVAIEFQGGSWVKGAHTRGKHFESDCEKFSEAAVRGWRILLCTYDQVKRGELFVWIEAIFP